MSEQNPAQYPPRRPPAQPSGEHDEEPSDKTPPEKDPCAEPGKPPCPPEEAPCPPKKGKDCPDDPPPDPDPCAQRDDDEEETTGGTAEGRTEQSATPAAGNGQEKDPVKAQLDRLRAQLKADQEKLQGLEPLKTSVADITQRIQALEKTVDEKSTNETSYRDFYRQIEVFKKELETFIPSVRCQLKVTQRQKECICKAIENVDEKVDDATRQSKKAREDAEKAERKYKKAVDKLAWVKKWYEFLKSGLQQQIAKQRDDLKGLKGLADPAKDQCEVWFYLYELDRLLQPAEGGACCWKPDIWISTFLNCWPWDDCYKDKSNQFLVAFNESEADEKLLKSKLEQAKKRADDLDKIAKDYQGKRREWILKAIKNECCGPFAACPPEKTPAATEGGARAAR